MDIQISDERHGPRGQYHLMVDGADVGELDYHDDGGRRAFTHTGVRAEFEGRGLAAQLVRRGLDDARNEGLEVIASCSYVAAYLARHPDDADLLPRAE